MVAPTANPSLLSLVPRGAPTAPQRRSAAWLNEIAHLSLDEHEASELWQEVLAHKEEMSSQLGREVGWKVALVDHLSNVRPDRGRVAVIAEDVLEDLQQSALMDQLTGLFNRAYFDAQLARECERRRRYGSNAALMLLDLDRFKTVNDLYGHSKGDEVLRGVSEIVREYLRAADLPFRFGGDELAALLTDADATEAMAIAERVRAGIAEGYRHACVPITASIGVAMLRHCPRDRMEEDVFERADRALYAAKRAGGDRVVPDQEAEDPTPTVALA